MKPNNSNIIDNTTDSFRNEVPAQQIPVVNAEAVIINSGERERSCCCRFCDFTFQTFAAGFNLQALFAESFRADEKHHCHLSADQFISQREENYRIMGLYEFICKSYTDGNNKSTPIEC